MPTLRENLRGECVRSARRLRTVSTETDNDPRGDHDAAWGGKSIISAITSIMPTITSIISGRKSVAWSGKDFDADYYAIGCR